MAQTNLDVTNKQLQNETKQPKRKRHEAKRKPNVTKPFGEGTIRAVAQLGSDRTGREQHAASERNESTLNEMENETKMEHEKRNHSEKAQSEQSRNLAQTDLDGTNKQLQNLNTMAGDLHTSCDYTPLGKNWMRDLFCFVSFLTFFFAIVFAAAATVTPATVLWL